MERYQQTDTDTNEIQEGGDIPQVNPLNPAIEAILTMLPFLPCSNHFLIALPLTIAGAVRFKAMTLSHICLSCTAKHQSQQMCLRQIYRKSHQLSYHLSHRIEPINPPSAIYNEIELAKHFFSRRKDVFNLFVFGDIRLHHESAFWVCRGDLLLEVCNELGIDVDNDHIRSSA
jgi:hypothetical protein